MNREQYEKMGRERIVRGDLFTYENVVVPIKSEARWYGSISQQVAKMVPEFPKLVLTEAKVVPLQGKTFVFVALWDDHTPYSWDHIRGCTAVGLAGSDARAPEDARSPPARGQRGLQVRRRDGGGGRLRRGHTRADGHDPPRGHLRGARGDDVRVRVVGSSAPVPGRSPLAGLLLASTRPPATGPCPNRRGRRVQGDSRYRAHCRRQRRSLFAPLPERVIPPPSTRASHASRKLRQLGHAHLASTPSWPVTREVVAVARCPTE